MPGIHPSLTIFTIPWSTEVADSYVPARVLLDRQENSLISFTLLEPRPEILLCGNEEGIEETAERLGCTYVPDIEYDAELKIPVVSSVFEQALKLATGEFLCYANADDVFIQDFVEAIQVIAERFDKFLMIGRKWDVEIHERLGFSAGWQERLVQRAKRHGRLHGKSAVDYYVFRREHPIGVDMPPFVIGGTGWDTWLVDDSLMRGFPVIDVTESVNCVHQHIHGRRMRAKSDINRELFLRSLQEQGRTGDDLKGWVNHANWELKDGELTER